MKEESRNNQIEKALEAFDSSKLVGLPTETVYGLAAPINQEKLIKKTFLLKERPFFDPLIVHVSSVYMAKDLVEVWPEEADLLAKTFWPGPLTLVLKKKPEKIHDLITSGLPTVGIRMPNHPLALELIERMNTPLTAPSANKFTKVSPTRPEHVREAFTEDEVFVLDGGNCEIGIESTIVGIQENKVTILRPGMILPSDILEKTGLKVEESDPHVVAPGSMKIHYRPKFSLIIGEEIEQIQDIDLQLIESTCLEGKPELIARELYQILRAELPAKKEHLFLKIRSKDYNDASWKPILNRLKKAASINLFEKTNDYGN